MLKRTAAGTSKQRSDADRTTTTSRNNESELNNKQNGIIIVWDRNHNYIICYDSFSVVVRGGESVWWGTNQEILSVEIGTADAPAAPPQPPPQRARAPPSKATATGRIYCSYSYYALLYFKKYY